MRVYVAVYAQACVCMCVLGEVDKQMKKTILFFSLVEGLFQDQAGHGWTSVWRCLPLIRRMLSDLHKSFPLNFSYHCMDPSLLLDCSLLLSLFLLCSSLPSSLSFFGTPPWVTAQYPALLGLSSLSRWLTWITVHTPRSGPMIKTVTEGIYAISL